MCIGRVKEKVRGGKAIGTLSAGNLQLAGYPTEAIISVDAGNGIFAGYYMEIDTGKPDGGGFLERYDGCISRNGSRVFVVFALIWAERQNGKR